MTTKPAATNARTFRTFLLMQQFAAAEIGARIARARHEAGAMTQVELAELLNVSARSVQDYEAGIRMPWRHFKELEQIFGRPMDWFLHGDSEPGAGADSTASRLDRIEATLAERRVIDAEILRLLEKLQARSEQDEADTGS